MTDKKDKSCKTCRHLGFTTPEPHYHAGHGSNLWCKLHGKRITGEGCRGADWQDRYEKKPLTKGDAK